MSHSQEGKKGPRTRSIALVLLAWVFISGQALLAAGNIYNYANTGGALKATAEAGSTPWELAAQSAQKMHMIAMQARPDGVGKEATFLVLINTLGLVALFCALLSWSRSGYRSGKVTMAAAMALIVANAIANLPYA